MRCISSTPARTHLVARCRGGIPEVARAIGKSFAARSVARAACSVGSIALRSSPMATDLPIITFAHIWSFCVLKAITAPPAINSGWTWMFRSDVAALDDAWGQRPGHEVMS